MAIYLEKLEREYLKYLLSNKETTYWVHKKLQQKLQQEEERLQEIKDCSHKFAEYEGKKECCSKCGGLDIEMGEEWTLTKPIEAHSKMSNNEQELLF